MTLKRPNPGLRRLWHNSNQPAKVQVTIQPGDELEVSDDVAAQLTAASTHFVDGPPPAPASEPTGSAEGAADQPAAKAPAGKARPAKKAAQRRS